MLKKGIYKASVGTDEYEVRIERDGTVSVNGIVYDIKWSQNTSNHYTVQLLNDTYTIELPESSASSLQADASNKIALKINNKAIEVIINDQQSLLIKSWMQRKQHTQKNRSLVAPMPGFIGKINVQAGDIVEKDSLLCVLEAMKMENEIRSLQKIRIDETYIQSGAVVERNAILMMITEL
jgi:biotin carboxyl carrier protein